VRVRDAGEVIELTREELVALVQVDAELGEILMRAFVLRRAELIASGSATRSSSDRAIRRTLRAANF
jgi:thioredoxin reductase (NADPH)